MLSEHVQHFVALLFESALIRLFFLEVGGVVPPGLPQTGDLIECELALSIGEAQPCMSLEPDKAQDFLDQCLYNGVS